MKIELEALPDKIDFLEKQISELQIQTQEKNFYTQPYETVQAVILL